MVRKISGNLSPQIRVKRKDGRCVSTKGMVKDGGGEIIFGYFVSSAYNMIDGKKASKLHYDWMMLLLMIMMMATIPYDRSADEGNPSHCFFLMPFFNGSYAIGTATL